MSSFAAILAPFALLLPLGAVGLPVQREDVRHEGPISEAPPLSGSVRDWSSLSDPLEGQIANQVRIERRVILRVSPRPIPSQRNIMADLPSTAIAPRMTERSAGKCLDIAGIAGVQADRGSRLMLFMRDRRVIAADLEKSCSSREFYSGFYVEQNKDGRLCVDRDRLQSRSGAKCEVSRFRQMVIEED